MKALIYILILFSLIGCEDEGTDTGNPGFVSGTPADMNGNPLLPTGSRLDEVVAVICYQLSACEADILIGCNNYVYSQTNIDEEIGLTVNAYSKLSAAAQDNNAGNITLNDTALDQCKTDIYALSCSLPDVVNAYDPLQTNKYEGVATLLPLSCEGIF